MLPSARILIVDNEEDILVAARLLLKPHFTSITTLRDPTSLADRTRAKDFDVLLLDMNFARGADSGAEGLYYLSTVLAIDPDAVIVLITAHADLELAVAAMKKGAADFVTKPWENERLLATVTAAANLRASRTEAEDLRLRNRALAAITHSDSGLVGSSPCMLNIFDLVHRAAPTDANVLILGENGTGKEMIAREIHRLSDRSQEAFVQVDLGSISPALFESELFGHRRGAFTDAREDRAGRFRAAKGGTLFLDEIGNVPLHLQSKLLGALERREIIPIGSEQPEPMDVRVICATNLPGEQLGDPNVFRQDLLYRINTVTITLPPLRSRSEDIAPLVEHFIAVYARKYNFPRKRLNADALEKLTRYQWPGNVRELKHAVERATILSNRTVLASEDFVLSGQPVEAVSPPEADALTLATLERDTISRALDLHKGNISRAAAKLGLTRAALYRRMEKYGL